MIGQCLLLGANINRNASPEKTEQLHEVNKANSFYYNDKIGQKLNDLAEIPQNQLNDNVFVQDITRRNKHTINRDGNMKHVRLNVNGQRQAFNEESQETFTKFDNIKLKLLKNSLSRLETVDKDNMDGEGNSPLSKQNMRLLQFTKKNIDILQNRQKCFAQNNESKSYVKFDSSYYTNNPQTPNCKNENGSPTGYKNKKTMGNQFFGKFMDNLGPTRDNFAKLTDTIRHTEVEYDNSSEFIQTESLKATMPNPNPKKGGFLDTVDNLNYNIMHCRPLEKQKSTTYRTPRNLTQFYTVNYDQSMYDKSMYQSTNESEILGYSIPQKYQKRGYESIEQQEAYITKAFMYIDTAKEQYKTRYFFLFVTKKIDWPKRIR